MSHLIAPITLSLVISQISAACQQNNASCQDLKVADGYVYPCTAPVGSEIEVYHDKTLIAFFHKQSIETEPPVIRMDKEAVVTSSCLNLTIRFVIPLDEKGLIEEKCSAYVVTEARGNTKNVVPAPQWSTIFGSLVALLSVGVLAVLLYFGISRKYRQRNGIYDLERGGGEEGSRLNELRTHTDLHGSNDHEDVENAQVSSIDPQTDDRTAEAPGLAPSPRNARAKQPNEVAQHGHSGSEELNAGPTTVLDANAISSKRAMNRNLRDDPGGRNSNNGTDIKTIDERTSRIGDTSDDEASDGQKVDHHHTEQQLLLRRDDNNSGGTKDNGSSDVESSGIKIQ